MVTRILLGLILLLVVVLVGLDQSDRGAPTEGVVAQVPGERFELLVSRSRELGPSYVRFDTATGKAWRMAASGVGPWVQVGEHGAESGQGSESLAAGRYTMELVRSSFGPVLIRTDTATGLVWKLPLPDGEEWLVLGEETDAAGSGPAVRAGSPEDPALPRVRALMGRRGGTREAGGESSQPETPSSTARDAPEPTPAPSEGS